MSRAPIASFGFAFLSIGTTLVLASAHASAGTIFVNVAQVTGLNNGSTWADAYQGIDGLKTALTAAVAGDQIWVAKGTYKPTTTLTRSIYFDLKNNVELYGGFVGSEAGLDQRDVVLNPTILSGDLNNDDGSNAFADNSFHLLNGGTVNSTAVVDGFTVRGGNANGTGGNTDRGGGILCVGGASPTIRSCVFIANRCTFGGGAGYINASSPNFTDVRFDSNVGGSFGGAFDMATNVAASYTRCSFLHNTAARAGGIEIFSSGVVKVTNCLFFDNTSTGSGGGGAIFVSASSPSIRNCTIVGNKSTVNATAGILGGGGSTSVANCILYFNQGPGGVMGSTNQVSNAGLSYCCVQGGAIGTAILTADPQLVNFGGGDFTLSTNSPCADAGNNAAVPVGTTTDLAGNARFADDSLAADSGSGSAPIVDMGAWEVPNTLYANFCAGDGTLATACPCGNSGATGRGCLNSDFFSPGALLSVSGAASPDTVVLTASDMLASVPCIFLQGDAPVTNGIVFGDGVRCVGGHLKRLALKIGSG